MDVSIPFDGRIKVKNRENPYLSKKIKNSWDTLETLSKIVIEVLGITTKTLKKWFKILGTETMAVELKKSSKDPLKIVDENC